MDRPLPVPHPRFLGFLLALAVTFGGGLAAGWSFRLAGVIAFDVAALGFIAAALPLWLGKPSADDMRARAARDDGGRVILLLLAAIIAGIVLVCVVGLLGEHRATAPLPAEPVAIVTEVVAWLFTNLIYAFHYARLYYDRGTGGGDHGGIELPGDDKPDFADFVTFAFVIGMTCQTADIEITGHHIRRASTVHGLIAFFFNLGVLAITVNVVAGAL